MDPVGLRLFGELGKVGIPSGDLGFAGLKSSVGVSVTFRLGGASVFELSFAWGGGEGTHMLRDGEHEQHRWRNPWPPRRLLALVTVGHEQRYKPFKNNLSRRY